MCVCLCANGGLEYLDPIIPEIDHNNFTVWCETNAAGTIHFTWFEARGAKLVDEATVRLEYLKTENC